MITVELEGVEAAVKRFGKMPESIRKALLAKVTALTLQLEARVKRKVSGVVLKVRTGRLRRSIHSKFLTDSSMVVGMVASSADVRYARIHEYGGKTAPHVIRAKNGKALAFQMGGKMRFAAYVNHPGSVIPARPYMRPSLAEMRPQIEKGLEEAVGAGANAGAAAR